MTQPKPWSMNKYGRVLDANGEPVVLYGFSLSCGGRWDSRSPEQNDAEIVRAVNCHGDLVAACELAAEAIRLESSASAWRKSSIAIDAAIKKARGE